MDEAVEAIRVLVAGEQALFRQAVRIVLEREADLIVVAEAHTGIDAISEAERVRPDVALLPARPPRLEGLAATAALRDRLPSCRVIVLTDEGDPQILHKAIEAGAAGYLTKDIQMSELTAGIRAVHRGDTLVPPNMLGGLFDGFFSAVVNRARRCACSRDSAAASKRCWPCWSMERATTRSVTPS